MVLHLRKRKAANEKKNFENLASHTVKERTARVYIKQSQTKDQPILSTIIFLKCYPTAVDLPPRQDTKGFITNRNCKRNSTAHCQIVKASDTVIGVRQGLKIFLSIPSPTRAVTMMVVIYPAKARRFIIVISVSLLLSSRVTSDFFK